MKNRPVVIGIGCIQQKGNFDDLDEALILMDKAFKKAVDDTTNKKIRKAIKNKTDDRMFFRNKKMNNKGNMGKKTMQNKNKQHTQIAT